MRIVSLLPSATEILCGLGLRDQLVGVTDECDYPPGINQLPTVTRTLIPGDASSLEIDGLVRERLQSEQALYSLDLSVMKTLDPDLIVTQTLCDVCAVSEREVNAAVCELGGRARVVNLQPHDLADVLDSIRIVAEAAGCVEKAAPYVANLQDRIDTVVARGQAIQRRPRVLLLEWIDPPFCAGHWSPQLVQLAGGQELFGVAGQRSVTLTWDAIADADPDVMVIACCGFDIQRARQEIPVLRSRPEWNLLACVKTDRVYMVDGSAYFNRPGPRLVDSLEILAHALHPDRHPLPSGLEPALKVSIEA
ncbi:cobalamin-binding protein [Stieleria sp. TO1_6]|uniref:cobalamin-binding protein n=1 Tax=Stieleria tagensis TaxID=2956795 RepID=UPI00209B57A2|nr:cobalamin-binding protein [Stieleria tagensis]MCO8125115.1 cobalamin-binding protein [Stieleria tagensis]